MRGWDGKKGAVTNAIADDELGRWIAAIRETGAFVWIIFDHCNSGTMTRAFGSTALARA